MFDREYNVLAMLFVLGRLFGGRPLTTEILS